MSSRRLKEGDLIILDDMPSGWSRPGEDYMGMLYERFDMHGGSTYPTWCWKIKWFSDIPLSYNYKWGMGETNILNLTSVKRGTHIPINEDTYNDMHVKDSDEISI